MSFAARLSFVLLTTSLIACQAPQQPANPSSSQTSAIVLSANSQIPVGKAPHGISAASGFVYNSNSEENTLTVIEAKTDKAVTTITLPSGRPGYSKATYDGKYILVVNPDAGQLHVFAPAQNHQLVQSINVGQKPDRVLISDDDRKVWVSLAGESAIAELSFNQGLTQAPTLKKIPAGQPNANDEHRGIGHGLSWLATTNNRDNDVTLIASTGESKTVRAGNFPSVLGFGSWDNQDQVLIIGNSTSNTVTLQPLDGGAAVTLEDAGLTPTEIAVVPRLERAYITMAGSNDVAVIDYRNKKLVGRIPVGKRPVHVFEAPALPTVQHDGEDHSAPELWVGNDAGASVSVIDGQSLAVKATVQTGNGHHKLAFADGKVFVSNITDNTVSVIDRLKLKL